MEIRTICPCKQPTPQYLATAKLQPETPLPPHFRIVITPLLTPQDSSSYLSQPPPPRKILQSISPPRYYLTKDLRISSPPIYNSIFYISIKFIISYAFSYKIYSDKFLIHQKAIDRSSFFIYAILK